MEKGIATFEMFAELQQLAERAFVYRLREKDPKLSEEQIEVEFCRWLKERPGSEFGDGIGRVGDISRFKS